MLHEASDTRVCADMQHLSHSPHTRNPARFAVAWNVTIKPAQGAVAVLPTVLIEPSCWLSRSCIPARGCRGAGVGQLHLPPHLVTVSSPSLRHALFTPLYAAPHAGQLADVHNARVRLS